MNSVVRERSHFSVQRTGVLSRDYLSNGESPYLGVPCRNRANRVPGELSPAFVQILPRVGITKDALEIVCQRSKPLSRKDKRPDPCSMSQ